jgi:iron complex transport system ATP-binding protein
MSLSVRNLTVAIDGCAILQGASLDVPRGRITALVGPNGSGKTTLVRAIAALLPYRGTITADGQDLSVLPPQDRARMIGYLPQDRSFAWPIMVEDAVRLGRFAYGEPLGRTPKEGERIVRDTIATCGLSGFRERSVATLSGGEAARVHAARLLAGRATYLLADEPAAALDPRHAIALMELFRREARERQAGVLLVLHDLDLAARYADEVVVLLDGKTHTSGPAADVLTATTIGKAFGVPARTEGGRILLGN